MKQIKITETTDSKIIKAGIDAWNWFLKLTKKG